MARPPSVRAEPHPTRELIVLHDRDGRWSRELRLDDARDLAVDILVQARDVEDRPTRDWVTGPPEDPTERGIEP